MDNSWSTYDKRGGPQTGLPVVPPDNELDDLWCPLSNRWDDAWIVE